MGIKRGKKAPRITMAERRERERKVEINKGQSNEISKGYTFRACGSRQAATVTCI